MTQSRTALTVRVSRADKKQFVDSVVAAGLEPGVAARQLFELVARRLRTEPDYIVVLAEVNEALKPKEVIV